MKTIGIFLLLSAAAIAMSAVVGASPLKSESNIAGAGRLPADLSFSDSLKLKKVAQALLPSKSSRGRGILEIDEGELTAAVEAALHDVAEILMNAQPAIVTVFSGNEDALLQVELAVVDAKEEVSNVAYLIYYYAPFLGLEDRVLYYADGFDYLQTAVVTLAGKLGEIATAAGPEYVDAVRGISEKATVDVNDAIKPVRDIIGPLLPIAEGKPILAYC